MYRIKKVCEPILSSLETLNKGKDPNDCRKTRYDYDRKKDARFNDGNSKNLDDSVQILERKFRNNQVEIEELTAILNGGYSKSGKDDGGKTSRRGSGLITDSKTSQALKCEIDKENEEIKDLIILISAMEQVTQGNYPPQRFIDHLKRRVRIVY